MSTTRRKFLGGSLTVAALAGCLGDGDGTSDDSSNGGPDSGERSTGDGLELNFGEGGVFTDDSGVELGVEIGNPRLRTSIPVVTGDNEINVDSPESSEYFFFADVALRNDGSSSIDPPRGLYFRADGEEVDRAAIRTPGQKYRSIDELAPGESATGTIAFPAPAEAETATVTLRFQALRKSEPAHWTTDYAEIEKSSTDLSREGIGESITIEAEDLAYEFTPQDVQRTDSYTHGDGEEHSASAGSTFVLLTAQAESVGDAPVKLPTPYDIRLGADGEEVRSDQFEREEERYEGRVDPTPPDGNIEGTLLYEVPESASELTVRLAVGNKTFATWPISGE